MVIYMKKRTIFLKGIGIVFVLLIFRFLIDFFNLDILPEINLIGCFVGGTLFVIAIIMASVFSDFKESEKIADDLPAAITNLLLYSKIIQTKDDRTATFMRSHIRNLLSTINSNFKRNEWKLEDIHSKIYIIVDDIKSLKENNVEEEFIVALQDEVMNVIRMLNRIDTIVKTKFVPALYLASYVTIGISVLLLLFAQMASDYEALILVGSISFVLVILIMLVLDMENPFEVGKNTEAEVDLSHLFDLEEHLEK